MKAKANAPMRLMLDIREWKEQTATLTPLECAALLAMKMHYWRIGQIPDRDAALAQITGMGIKEWKEARQGLEPLFIIGEGEWFRTDWNEELEAAYVALKKYSEASKTANKVRWDKQKRRVSASDSESDSESGSESGKDSDSHPASLLKYKGKAPSQEVDGFVSADAELEQAVSAIESGWKEAANV